MNIYIKNCVLLGTLSCSFLNCGAVFSWGVFSCLQVGCQPAGPLKVTFPRTQEQFDLTLQYRKPCSVNDKLQASNTSSNLKGLCGHRISELFLFQCTFKRSRFCPLVSAVAHHSKSPGHLAPGTQPCDCPALSMPSVVFINLWFLTFKCPLGGMFAKSLSCYKGMLSV